LSDQKGLVYLCPTPIGNLGDITCRVLQVLSEVDLIACEDTRRTGKLLQHFGLSAPMISYHEHNQAERTSKLINQLRKGKKIAVVTDAGTPGMSDPGFRLVEAAIHAGMEVVSLPGPCAFVTALVASGLPPEPCSFYGFLPRRGKKRRELLKCLSCEKKTFVLYEAPHRLTNTLRDLIDLIGGERQAVLGRELTKIHEQYLRGTLAQLLQTVEKGQLRGEYVLVVAGKKEEPPDADKLDELLDKLLASGLSPRDASIAVSVFMNVPRNLAYGRLLDLHNKKPPQG